MKAPLWFATNLHIRRACSKGCFSPSLPPHLGAFYEIPRPGLKQEPHPVGYSQEGAPRAAAGGETNGYVRRLPKGFSQNPPVPPAGTAGASLLVPPFAFPAHNLLLWTLIKGLIHNIRGSPASSSRQDAPRSTQSIPLLSAPSALFVCTARAFALCSGLTLPRLVPDTPANTRSPFSRAHFPKKGNPNLKPKPFLLFP